MAVTPQTVRDLSFSGEFDDYTDEQISALITDAGMFVEGIGDVVRQERVQALLAAHMLATQAAGGARPAVVSETFGPASRTFERGSTAGRFTALRLHATVYGLRFEALLETIPKTPLVVFDGTLVPERDY